jgi:hypothetical protein
VKRLVRFIQPVIDFLRGKRRPEPTPEPEPELQPFPVGDNTFLWKPGSHTDGTLVVLFPSRMPYTDIRGKWLFQPGTRFITGAWIGYFGGRQNLSIRRTHISEPPAAKTDKLNPNGNRVHARTSHYGEHYGHQITVHAEWRTADGDTGTASWIVPDGAQRYSKR